MLPLTMKNGLIDYCNDSQAVNFAYIKDLLIDYLEPKNLNNESLVLSELSNDLINIRNLIKRKEFDKAKAKFERLESKLNNL